MTPHRRVKTIAQYSTFPAHWRDLVSRGQPFIASGVGRSRLSLDLVAKVGTSTEIIVKNQVNGDVGQATLSELVGCLGQEGATWYMAQHAVPPCLDRHVPKRPLAGAAGLRKPNIWLGSARAFTQLHQDVLHNVILQLDGRKQFTIFAPGDDRYLYRETSEERPNYSQIARTSAADLRRFPEYRKAHPFCVELQPRDVFVLPAYWWHEVLTLESSLMLNYWWAPTLRSVRGIDVQRQIFSSSVARRHVMKHLDLTGLESDHVLVDELSKELILLAAIVLNDMVDEFLESLAAKHHLDRGLYPATCEALLKTNGKLPTEASGLLKQIREDAATAETFLKNKEPPPALGTVKLNRRLRELSSANRLPPCRRMLQNNRAWMKHVSADSYLF